MRRALPAALVLLGIAAAPGPAGGAPPTAPRNPVEERLSRATAELERDGRTARAIVPLAELADLEEELPVLARLVPIYARAAEDRAAPSEIRALARLRLSRLERSRGNLQRSLAQLRRIGFVTGWMVVGPFDDEGRRGLETAYPPERTIDLEAAVKALGIRSSYKEIPGRHYWFLWRDFLGDFGARLFR